MKTMRVINNTLTVHFENKLSFFLSYDPPVFTVTRHANNTVTIELGPIASGCYTFAASLSDIEKARFVLGHINRVRIGTKTDMHKVLDAFAAGEIQSNANFVFDDAGTFETPVGMYEYWYENPVQEKTP